MAADTAWVWLDDRRPADPGALARFALARGVREAFVSVPWQGPDGRVRATVAALRGAGVRVAALGGSPDWAQTPAGAQEWARRAHEGASFTGTHLDVEPWTLPGWSAHAEALLEGLVRAVHEVAFATRTRVEVDLTPRLARSHPDGFLAVARAADAVTLMSYRDTAGEILGVSAEARRLLGRVGRRYRLAVDTLPSADPGSTFAGQPAADLERETTEVARRIADDRCFAGVAVHDLAGWLALPGGG